MSQKNYRSKKAVRRSKAKKHKASKAAPFNHKKTNKRAKNKTPKEAAFWGSRLFLALLAAAFLALPFFYNSCEDVKFVANPPQKRPASKKSPSKTPPANPLSGKTPPKKIPPAQTPPATVDSTAPVVTITVEQSVASVTQAPTAEVHFVVDDADGSGIATVLCRAATVEALDGEDFVACTSPYSFSHTTGGAYKFEVKATDVAGNTSPVQDHSWCYGVDCGRTDKQITANSSTELERVGLLLMVDNSESMEDKQDALAKRGVPRLLKAMQGLKYRVAVTTTDYYRVSQEGVGQPFRALVDPLGNAFTQRGGPACQNFREPPSNKGRFVLDRAPLLDGEQANRNDAANFLSAKNSLKQTLLCMEQGSPIESALASFLKLIRAYDNNKTKQAILDSSGLWFFQNLRHLVVVLLTDEGDEYIWETKKEQQKLKQPLTHLTSAEVRDAAVSIFPQASFVWHSILNKREDNRRDGRYQVMTQLTGGLFGDVEIMDTYASVLQEVAGKARRMVMQVELECQPLNYKNADPYDARNAGHRLVEVLDASDQPLSPQPQCTLIDNLKVDCKKCVESNGATTCSGPLDSGQYKFKYQCAAI